MPDLSPTVERMQQALMRDVGGVQPDAMVLDFHINTKLAHALNFWRGHDSEKDYLLFESWCRHASIYLASLEPSEKVNGRTGEAQDPLRAARDVFPDGKPVSAEKLGTVVMEMYERCKMADPPFRSFDQDHVNLLELAHGCGYIPLEPVKTMMAVVYGCPKTNQEIIEEFRDELMGGAMLGEQSLTEGKGFDWFTAVAEAGEYSVLKDDAVATLGRVVVRGYGGRPCIFAVVTNGRRGVIIQPRTHQGTSVTNLAEPLLQTLGRDTHFRGEPMAWHEHYEGEEDIHRVALVDGAARRSPIDDQEEAQLRQMIEAALPQVGGPEM